MLVELHMFFGNDQDVRFFEQVHKMFMAELSLCMAIGFAFMHLARKTDA